MGHEIFYCSTCRTQLRTANLEEGKAFELDGASYCKACVPIAALLKEKASAAAAESTPAAPSGGSPRRDRKIRDRRLLGPEGPGGAPIAAALTVLLGLGFVFAALESSDPRET
jgi:hypothetical protein